MHLLISKSVRRRPAIHLIPLMLCACMHGQEPLQLKAGNLTGSIALDAGHLKGLVMRDEASGRSLSLDNAFRLTLSDGRSINASDMRLMHAAARMPLAAEASASRAAAKFSGEEVCADLADAQSGAKVHWCLLSRGAGSYLRDEITIQAGSQPLPLTDIQLVSLQDSGIKIVGTVAGSPLVCGDFFLGFEHPLSYSHVQSGHAVAGLKRSLPLPAGQSITYSAVIGVARPGQLRRDFLSYVELERAHPYRTFLHYNTWYDLGEGNRFGAAEVLNRMHAFGDELVRKRSVTMDSFLMDDGWDNTSSLWQFDSGFPDGFTPLRATARSYGFGIGVWLSPWGGYEAEKDQRIAYGRSHGYEIIDNGYALSGPRYYEKFEEACLNFIKRYGVNQFKLDGTGNADQVFPGSIYDSDFSAAIHLIERLRQQDEQVFINLTTGTKPSPFWLRYADSIWRSGEDHDFAGEGSWRQRWITYRDEQTYRNIVEAGPLFPLNSLMLHGIIYAQKAEHLGDDPDHDFTSEVRSYFGTGTQLQEMYITPSLLSKENWDTLAESARWSRSNASILRDTHWVGGDPGKGSVYGWAAWSANKGILTLRNPSPRPQSISIDVQQAFELPPDAATQYRAHSPWAGEKSQTPISLRANQPHTFSLKPFEVLTLEAEPF